MASSGPGPREATVSGVPLGVHFGVPMGVPLGVQARVAGSACRVAGVFVLVGGLWRVR